MKFKITQWTTLIVTSLLIITVGSMLMWYFGNWSGSSGRFNQKSKIYLSDSHERYIICQDGQFSPNVISIRIGDQITWINNSESTCQIVSDSPQARYLPKLKSNVLDEGELFSMSFPIPGDWRYHDGVNLSGRGRIIIE